MSCDANIAEEAGNSLYEWLNVYRKLEIAMQRDDNVWLRNVELAIASYELMLNFISKIFSYHGDFSDANCFISFFIFPWPAGSPREEGFAYKYVLPTQL